MTTEQKVALVASVQEEFGLAPALAAVALPKSTWYYQHRDKVAYAEKYAHLLPLLEEIARAHPAYGYRRTTEELQRSYGRRVNHKVVRRLHQLWDLRLLRNTRPPKPSGIRQTIKVAGGKANLVAQLEQIGLFEVTYTDFTELRFADGREKAFLMPLLGHCSKLVYGWAVGKRDNTVLALRAWGRAKETWTQWAVSLVGMIVHHDRDPVFTGYGWTEQLLLRDQVRISYALRGARDNPEMEAFFSRFKTENRSLFLEAQDVAELTAVVDERMHYYNIERRHSVIGYLSPMRYIEQLRQSINVLTHHPMPIGALVTE